MHFYVLMVGFFGTAWSKKRYALDYGFNQWSVVSKKLYIYLVMVKQYILSYIHVLYANIFPLFMI